MTQVTENICCVKSEGTVDHRTVTRGSKKFCLVFKNLNDQIMSTKPKTKDSKAVLQASLGFHSPV